MIIIVTCCVCKIVFGRMDKTKNETNNIKTSGFSFQERCIRVMQNIYIYIYI